MTCKDFNYFLTLGFLNFVLFPVLFYKEVAVIKMTDVFSFLDLFGKPEKKKKREPVRCYGIFLFLVNIEREYLKRCERKKINLSELPYSLVT